MPVVFLRDGTDDRLGGIRVRTKQAGCADIQPAFRLQHSHEERDGLPAHQPGCFAVTGPLAGLDVFVCVNDRASAILKGTP